jgi:hypothetical protein
MACSSIYRLSLGSIDSSRREKGYINLEKWHLHVRNTAQTTTTRFGALWRNIVTVAAARDLRLGLPFEIKKGSRILDEDLL